MTSETEATTHMLLGLVVASAYFECTDIPRDLFKKRLESALSHNEWAQRAAMDWFDSLTAQYTAADQPVDVVDLLDISEDKPQ